MPQSKFYKKIAKQDTKQQTYEYTKNVFYKLHSANLLCYYLKINRQTMNLIIKLKNEKMINFQRSETLISGDYEEIKCEKNKILIKSIRKNIKTNKIRTMVYPRSLVLHKIYYQLYKYLNRIERPKYNYIRKRNNNDKNFSHVAYVKYHSCSRSCFTIDVANFYPSITKEMVFNFFKYENKCSINVAKKLAELCTQQYIDEKGNLINCIAQGACFSHILSWLVCKNCFDKIYNECEKRNIKFSNWIDDMAFSGKGCFQMIPIINKILKNHGLKINWRKLHKFSNFKEISSHHDKQQKTETIMGLEIRNDNKMYVSNKTEKNKPYQKYVNRMNEEDMEFD